MIPRRADLADPGANLPGQMIFTCLSSDIVAHEVTHALLHRLRPHFSESANPDVFAWHEACADLIALFQQFAYTDIVTKAVADTEGDLRHGVGLLEPAREFGESTGRGKALRSAIDDERSPDRFRAAQEPHERGACFVAAVFDAFTDTFRAGTADLLRIASGGTGVLPAGRLSPDLVPAPAPPLRLEGADGPVDLGPLMLAVTQDLDLSGRAGDCVPMGEPVGPDAAAASALRGVARELARWAAANAGAIGLEPGVPIMLHDMHVTYLQAADHQARIPRAADGPARHRALAAARRPRPVRRPGRGGGAAVPSGLLGARPGRGR